jgi:hypothetical protein
MHRWLDRRSIWQFALLMWAGAIASCLVPVAVTAVWHPGYVDRYSLIGPFIVSIVWTVGAVVFRQRREDANTVAEWVESRRPPTP